MGGAVIEIQFSGLEGLEKALRELPQEVAGKVLSAALRKAATPMAQAAAASAPRSANPGRNGHMADSIRLRTFRDSSSVNDLEVNLALGPDGNHFYGSFGEFGTVHEAAHPFMRPAFDGYKDQVIATLGTELWAGIERATKRLAK